MSKKVVLAHMPWEGKEYLVHALWEEKRLTELYADCCEQKSLLGNIYVGRIEKLAPGICGAFVSFAEQQNCFVDLSRVKKKYLLKKTPGEELQAGDEILLQIQREAQKTKLPSATTELSLSGTNLALYYGKPEISCSGKLAPEEKKRLKELGGQIFPASSEKENCFGVIFRTAAAQATEEELRMEYLELSEKLTRIVTYGKMRNLYSCLYQASDSVPELFKRHASSLETVVTDDTELYRACKEYQEQHGYEKCQVQCYEDPMRPLWKQENLDTCLKEALEKKVELPSGGFLVIEPTEALTAIDVNSGKQLGRKNREFLYQVNLEAAEEIVRQIRLRGLSGLILVDFINMPQKEQEEQLLAQLSRLVKADPVPTKVVDMTALHLVEMTRKKIRRPLAEQIRQR